LQLIDLSHPLSPETPFIPGTPPVEIDVLERTEDAQTKGRRSLNVTRMAMMVHTGTHMDAPFHFFKSGRTIDEIPLDYCVGPALLVSLSGLVAGEEIDLTTLPGLKEKLHSVRKVVLNTGWACRWGTPAYFTDHPRISGQSAEFLRACGVHLVGVDTPSVDRPPFPAHLAFLGNGVVIVENLTNLEAIREEMFHLTVVPLKLSGRDGSPVRAIASVRAAGEQG
jgi:kynurenine formamidase